MRRASTPKSPLPDMGRWTEPTLRPVPLVREILRRFVAVQAVDRGVAIGAHAFTAIVPLLMLYGALGPRSERLSFADQVIARFDLSGPSAEAIRQALTPTVETTSSVSFIGFALLLVAALSFTRAVQRLHESAYGLAPRGLRGTGSGLMWLVVLLIPTTLRPLVTSIQDDWLPIALTLAISAAFWTATPIVLTGRRVNMRQALPAGLLCAVAMTILGVASALWLPHSVATSAAQYGLIGVAFAFVSWLVGTGLTLAAVTVAGSVISEGFGARAERRTARKAARAVAAD